MRFQDYICTKTQEAADEAFRYAKAVAGDKTEWAPLDNGRTVLGLAQEMAKCPDWAVMLVLDQDLSNSDGGEDSAPEQKDWTTIDRCQAECNARLAKMFEVVRNTTDERLQQTRPLVYSPTGQSTYADIIEYPRWNFTYHLGQIGYIQTLYGDKGMH